MPPGVDLERFRPLGDEERRRARERFGLEPDDLVVASVSRLVPRKGMDTLIRAAAQLRTGYPDLRVVIAGRGRDRERLGRLVARIGAPVEFAGFVDEADKAALMATADVFAMVCRNRWAGLEQEGFGIVFAEAAACGVPQVCGQSGGAAEAVEDGVTGLVVERSPGHRARSWPASIGCWATPGCEPAWEPPPGAGPNRTSTTTGWPGACATALAAAAAPAADGRPAPVGVPAAGVVPTRDADAAAAGRHAPAVTSVPDGSAPSPTGGRAGGSWT